MKTILNIEWLKDLKNIDNISDYRSIVAVKSNKIIEISNEILPFLSYIYYDEFVLSKSVNLISDSILRVSFFFPEYKRTKFALSWNHVSVNQINEALVEWFYLVSAYILKQRNIEIYDSELDKKIVIDYEKFLDMSWKALYRKDKRKFKKMLECWNEYYLDFFIKKLSLKKWILSVLIWFSWFVEWESESIIFIDD